NKSSPSSLSSKSGAVSLVLGDGGVPLINVAFSIVSDFETSSGSLISIPDDFLSSSLQFVATSPLAIIMADSTTCLKRNMVFVIVYFGLRFFQLYRSRRMVRLCILSKNTVNLLDSL